MTSADRTAPAVEPNSSTIVLTMTAIPETIMRPQSIRNAEGGMSKQEQHIVERLARETESSEQEARRAFESERERLARNARVQTYVTVIAARHARDTLRRKSG